MPSTVKLRRVLATQPEKVYRAFLEPDAVASWLPSFGFTCTVHELEAKEGGKHRMSFRNFTTGNSHSFGGTYLKRAGQRRQGSRSAKLAAMNLADGKLLWTREEFGYGTTIGVGDSLLALTENGELVTAKLSPNGYDEQGRLKALEKTCWTTPTVVDGRIYTRNDQGTLICLKAG